MKFGFRIDEAPETVVRGVLDDLLRANLHPAFGASSRAETDLALLRALQVLGALAPQPTLYELTRVLGVTKAKARNLLYALALRTARDDTVLDGLVREVLARPVSMKTNGNIALQVENPLVADHIRARLAKEGHAADGTFAASLLVLSPETMAILFEQFAPEAGLTSLDGALASVQAAGATRRERLNVFLGKACAKAAERAAADGMKQLAIHLGALALGEIPAIQAAVHNLFGS